MKVSTYTKSTREVNRDANGKTTFEPQFCTVDKEEKVQPVLGLDERQDSGVRRSRTHPQRTRPASSALGVSSSSKENVTAYQMSFAPEVVLKENLESRPESAAPGDSDDRRRDSNVQKQASLRTDGPLPPCQPNKHIQLSSN